MRLVLVLMLACRPRTVPPDYTPLVLEPASAADRQATVDGAVVEIRALLDEIVGLRRRDERCLRPKVASLEATLADAAAAAGAFQRARVVGDAVAEDEALRVAILARLRAIEAAEDARACEWEDPTPNRDDPLQVDPAGAPR